MTAKPETIDYSRKWHVMATVALGIFLGTVDGSIVNVALPTLVRSFKTEFVVVQWVMLSYMLTVTTLILNVGRLADIIGKRPLYASGFVVFTLGSFLCGISTSVYWLIGFRVLQAVGAAMMTALGSAILTEAFPEKERGKALGISGAVVSVGIMAGPVLGGIIINWLSWHWIFFVNLPVGIIGSIMAFRNIPNIKPREAQRFDFGGAATLLISLVSLLLALTLGQRIGFDHISVYTLFSIWGVFLIGFLFIETNIRQPLVELRVLRENLMSVNLICGFLAFFSIGGTILLMPFYLEDVLGYDPIHVGMLLAVVPVSLGLTSPIAGTLSDRFGTRPMTIIGLIIIMAGYFAMSTLTVTTTALGYILRFFPVGLGMGIFQSPNNSAIMGAAPKERLGLISGLLSVTRSLGQTTGIAALGVLWASRVAFHADGASATSASLAPAAARVSALDDVFTSIVALIAVALALSVWGFVKEKRLLSLGK